MDEMRDLRTMGDVSSKHRPSGHSEAQGPEAFRWLFVADYPALVRTLCLIVRDRAAAEDIAQEAYIQLLLHWDKVSGYDQPSTWVRRVAIRLAVRESRRVIRRSELERLVLLDDSLTETRSDPDLISAVRQLSARQRTIVVLFYLEDRPMDEIAELLGCSKSSGWVHLHRARARLADLLGEEVTGDVR